ncbi:uncharacterized protein N7459_010005 [Penicillium hispanicum]|uniref:uncharacterized protein n=1 Tax=Penicillium hispanicum TaxID=1080232 RepID=UPI002541C00F|nr:uncharacterized protein N7459_010005 [Penicillium hispanicum]KAJ5570575.1 hypothetical protein N7459_010005 [Penicillium hispanicum]
MSSCPGSTESSELDPDWQWIDDASNPDVLIEMGVRQNLANSVNFVGKNLKGLLEQTLEPTPELLAYLKSALETLRLWINLPLDDILATDIYTIMREFSNSEVSKCDLRVRRRVDSIATWWEAQYPVLRQ